MTFYHPLLDPKYLFFFSVETESTAQLIKSGFNLRIYGFVYRKELNKIGSEPS